MKDLFDITNLPRAQNIRGYFNPDIVLFTLHKMIRMAREAEDHEPTLRFVARQWHYWIKQLIIINSFNRNLQIITHVLSCAAGKAWAIKTIGMGRLRSWLFRYHNPAANISTSLPRFAPQKPAGHQQIKWSIIGLTPVSVFINTKTSTAATAKQSTSNGPYRAAQKRPFTPARFVPWELGVIDDIPATQDERQVRTNIYHRHIKKSIPNPMGIHYDDDGEDDKPP